MKKLMKTHLGRFAAGLIALLIVVGISCGAQHIPGLTADVTRQQVMTMSDASTEIAKGVEKDVVISYLATDSGKELWVEELAKKYAAANGKITYEMVAPTSSKASRLAELAGETAAENSVIVSCGDRAAVLSSEGLYSVVYDEMYLYYYGEYVAKEQYFVADEQIANAILYVTRDDLPVIYALSGHGETALGGYVKDQLFMSNIVLKTLSLSDAVPEDAAAVLIHAPTADLSDKETEALRSYLKNGGDLILMTGYMMEKLPNLNSLTAYYGMEQVCGVVIDSAAGYCYSAEYPQYIMPDVTEHAVTDVLQEANAKPTLSMAGGMQRKIIARSGLTVTELLTTSAQAHMKTTNEATTLEKEDGDPEGPFTVAMAAEDGETQIVWFGSGTFLSDNDISVSYGSNLYLLEETLKWMMPVGEQVNIETANLMDNALSVPAGQTNLIIALMFVPGLLALVIGAIMKKKK